jgi:hypothetical protein
MDGKSAVDPGLELELNPEAVLDPVRLGEISLSSCWMVCREVIKRWNRCRSPETMPTATGKGKGGIGKGKGEGKGKGREREGLERNGGNIWRKVSDRLGCRVAVISRHGANAMKSNGCI